MIGTIIFFVKLDHERQQARQDDIQPPLASYDYYPNETESYLYQSFDLCFTIRNKDKYYQKYEYLHIK